MTKLTMIYIAVHLVLVAITAVSGLDVDQLNPTASTNKQDFPTQTNHPSGFTHQDTSPEQTTHLTTHISHVIATNQPITGQANQPSESTVVTNAIPIKPFERYQANPSNESTVVTNAVLTNNQNITDQYDYYENSEDYDYDQNNAPAIDNSTDPTEQPTSITQPIKSIKVSSTAKQATTSNTPVEHPTTTTTILLTKSTTVTTTAQITSNNPSTEQPTDILRTALPVIASTDNPDPMIIGIVSGFALSCLAIFLMVLLCHVACRSPTEQLP